MVGSEHVEVLGHGVGKRAPCLQHGVHVGDLALDELEFSNALAELLAVVNVRDHVVHDGLHDAQRATGEHRTFVVQATHQHLGALVEAA
ncbi:hypothetical protein D3C72_2178850 [compost metagenome]